MTLLMGVEKMRGNQPQHQKREKDVKKTTSKVPGVGRTKQTEKREKKRSKR